MTAPAGGGDTSADSAACCTLRPKSVRNRGKSAGWRSAKLAAVDATAISKKSLFVESVYHTSASCGYFR